MAFFSDHSTLSPKEDWYLLFTHTRSGDFTFKICLSDVTHVLTFLNTVNQKGKDFIANRFDKTHLSLCTCDVQLCSCSGSSVILTFTTLEMMYVKPRKALNHL